MLGQVIANIVLLAAVAAIVLIVVRGLVRQVTVFEYQRGLRYRSGRVAGLVGPGRHWIFRPTTSIQLVDVRETFLAVAGQEVVTSDSVSVKLSLLVRYRLVDPIVALTQIDNYYQAVYSLVQVALREAVGALTIDDVLQRREEIGPEVLRRSAEDTRGVGVELISVDVRDLMFPGPLKKTFAQVIEARQQGLAALEKARGETAALRSLANAARMVEANPALLQLRLIQQLEATKGHTIVLGMPTTTTPVPIRSDGPSTAPELGSGDRSPTGEAD